MHLIYTTFPNKDEALNIAHFLVEEKLCACANVIDNVTSVYHWDNLTHEENEVIMISKTINELVDSVIYAIKKRHSAKTPCVISININKSEPEFFDWVQANTLVLDQK